MAKFRDDTNLLRVICLSVVLSVFYQKTCGDEEPIDEFLLCRNCGNEVTKSHSLVNIGSPFSQRQRNDTILGKQAVLIQLFENPQGRKFELITSTEADIYAQKESYAEFSWFPNFAWRICICPKCGFHLGWFFETIGAMPADNQDVTPKSFIGLILDNLLTKTYADSLVMFPKIYR